MATVPPQLPQSTTTAASHLQTLASLARSGGVRDLDLTADDFTAVLDILVAAITCAPIDVSPPPAPLIDAYGLTFCTLSAPEAAPYARTLSTHLCNRSTAIALIRRMVTVSTAAADALQRKRGSVATVFGGGVTAASATPDASQPASGSIADLRCSTNTDVAWGAAAPTPASPLHGATSVTTRPALPSAVVPPATWPGQPGARVAPRAAPGPPQFDELSHLRALLWWCLAHATRAGRGVLFTVVRDFLAAFAAAGDSPSSSDVAAAVCAVVAVIGAVLRGSAASADTTAAVPPADGDVGARTGSGSGTRTAAAWLATLLPLLGVVAMGGGAMGASPVGEDQPVLAVYHEQLTAAMVAAVAGDLKRRRQVAAVANVGGGNEVDIGHGMTALRRVMSAIADVWPAAAAHSSPAALLLLHGVNTMLERLPSLVSTDTTLQTKLNPADEAAAAAPAEATGRLNAATPLLQKVLSPVARVALLPVLSDALRSPNSRIVQLALRLLRSPALRAVLLQCEGHVTSIASSVSRHSRDNHGLPPASASAGVGLDVSRRRPRADDDNQSPTESAPWLLRALLPALLRGGEKHWNATVNRQTCALFKELLRIDGGALIAALAEMWQMPGSIDQPTHMPGAPTRLARTQVGAGCASGDYAEESNNPQSAIRRHQGAATQPPLASLAEAESTLSLATLPADGVDQPRASLPPSSHRLPPGAQNGLISGDASSFRSASAPWPGVRDGTAPPITVTGVAPWATTKAPPVTVTGVAPWATARLHAAVGATGAPPAAGALPRPDSNPRQPAVPASVAVADTVAAGTRDSTNSTVNASTDVAETDASLQLRAAVLARLSASLALLDPDFKLEPTVLEGAKPPTPSPSVENGVGSTATVLTLTPIGPPLPAALARRAELMPDLRFHGLVFGAQIGAGSFSTVREARRIVRGTPTATWPALAVKHIAADIIAAHAYDAAAAREVAVLASLRDHPGVARLISAFRWRGGVYLVTELCGGGDLHSAIVRLGSLDEPTARFVAAELLAALGAVHDAGFAFGDVKPENVGLLAGRADAREADGGGASDETSTPGPGRVGVGVHVKLLDLGAARPISAAGRATLARWCGSAGGLCLLDMLRDGGDDPSSRSSSHSAVAPIDGSVLDGPLLRNGSATLADALAVDDDRYEGTVEYLAPELAEELAAARSGVDLRSGADERRSNGPRGPSPASDAFAWGVTLFHMLAGRAPDLPLLMAAASAHENAEAGGDQPLRSATGEGKDPATGSSGAGQRVGVGVHFEDDGAAGDPFPASFPPLARDLIIAVTHPDPTRRLGGGRRGVAEVAEHPWFSSLVEAAARLPANGTDERTADALAQLSRLYECVGPTSLARGAAAPSTDPGWGRRHNSTIWAPLPRAYATAVVDKGKPEGQSGTTLQALARDTGRMDLPPIDLGLQWTDAW